MEMSCQL